MSEGATLDAAFSRKGSFARGVKRRGEGAGGGNGGGEGM
jgi:hypothetical protein